MLAGMRKGLSNLDFFKRCLLVWPQIKIQGLDKMQIRIWLMRRINLNNQINKISKKEVKKEKIKRRAKGDIHMYLLN